MKKKENIFNYATKELTQDAFLRWLLENYDSDNEDVKYVSRAIIAAFLDMQNIEAIEIEKIETIAQERKLDILVLISANQVKYLIAIEDKTDSSEHGNQLDNYKKHLQMKYADYQQHHIFYKTSPMTDLEISYISSKGWNVFDIDRIYSIFSIFNIEIKHYLLASYIHHIKSLHTLYRGDLPTDITEWSIKQWQNYAIRQSIKLPNDMDTMIGNYRNQYFMFAYNFKNQWKQGPYLEFRSRDVAYENFSMRILIYGLDKDIVDANIERWKEQIKRSKLYKVQNHKKQIGTSFIKEIIKNTADLEEVVTKYIDEFYSLMNF